MNTAVRTIALLVPGNSVHAQRWVNAFAQRGITVHLITQHTPLPGMDPRVVLHLLPHHGGLGYFTNGPQVRRLLRHLVPDVVNAHYATGYGTLARWCKPFPLVLNVWGSDVYNFPAKSALHRWWLCGNLKYADRVVSTSEAMADHTRLLCPVLARPAVVPFGVDLALFRPSPRTTGTSAPLVVGTVKTLAHTYGIDLLLRAFALLVGGAGFPQARLRIVGNGPQCKALKQLAADLGIADRVDMAGGVAHGRVPEELHKLDVFVALSRAESFGVAVVEASACGLPVVVSDAGGLPEVVQDGVTGFVVPGGDPQEAANRIGQLLADDALRGRMGAQGVRFVNERYAWGYCVDRMLEVLRSTVEAHRK